MIKEAVKGCLIAGVIGFLLSVGLVFGVRKIGSLVGSASPDALGLKQEEPAVEAKPERGRALKGVAQMHFTEQVETSKKQAVAKYPELGLRDTAVNREFVRRCKLLQTADPSFFDRADWPERLADLMARDLSLDPQRDSSQK
jgi:hypothetical protein